MFHFACTQRNAALYPQTALLSCPKLPCHPGPRAGTHKLAETAWVPDQVRDDGFYCRRKWVLCCRQTLPPCRHCRAKVRFSPITRQSRKKRRLDSRVTPANDESVVTGAATSIGFFIRSSSSCRKNAAINGLNGQRSDMRCFTSNRLPGPHPSSRT